MINALVLSTYLAGASFFQSTGSNSKVISDDILEVDDKIVYVNPRVEIGSLTAWVYIDANDGVSNYLRGGAFCKYLGHSTGSATQIRKIRDSNTWLVAFKINEIGEAEISSIGQYQTYKAQVITCHK